MTLPTDPSLYEKLGPYAPYPFLATLAGLVTQQFGEGRVTVEQLGFIIIALGSIGALYGFGLMTVHTNREFRSQMSKHIEKMEVRDEKLMVLATSTTAAVTSFQGQLAGVARDNRLEELLRQQARETTAAREGGQGAAGT